MTSRYFVELGHGSVPLNVVLFAAKEHVLRPSHLQSN